MTDSRISREIKHGRLLSSRGAGSVWNWESPAGRLRRDRRSVMLAGHIKTGMSVLELGCGTGYFTKSIPRDGNRIAAVDVSRELLASAKQNVPSKEVRFLRADACGLPFGDKSFHSVIGSSVLHHLDIKRALPEIFRVLRPKGTIVFTEPNMLNPQILVQKNVPFIKRMFGDSPDETAFVRTFLKKRLSQSGFCNIKITPFDFLHPMVPAMLLPVALPLCTFLENVPLLKEIAGSLEIRASRP
jgi:SAM-dependent methyltransferase